MSIEFFHLLILIIIANGSPIIIRVLLKDRFDLAVDFDKKLADQQPIFGRSKTWRGILSTLAFTPIAAWLLTYTPETGLLIASYAVTGDLLSSFIKRRLSMPPSSMAPLLDQIPESLFPAIMMMQTFELTISSLMLLVLTFVITELFLSYILYRLGIRKRPY